MGILGKTYKQEHTLHALKQICPKRHKVLINCVIILQDKALVNVVKPQQPTKYTIEGGQKDVSSQYGTT